MEATGEQVVPGQSSARLQEEHEARYEFAAQYAAGARVLDIACGTGYGAPRLLQAGAVSYTGVDLSADAIAHAKKHYASDKARFLAASAAEHLFNAGSFDLICSFETIEHLDTADRAAYLFNLSEYLRPGGTLLLSTPNKQITSPFTRRPLNPFHVLEFTKGQLLAEVSRHFKVEQVLGQRLVPKLASRGVVRRGIRVWEKVTRRDTTLYVTPTGPAVERYDESRREPRSFVLVCRKSY